MHRPLVGRLILVVEDEPLVALDVIRGLEAGGARVISARTHADALIKAEDPDLSAAVLDHGLREGDSSEVCEKLKARNIPFVLYSGYSNIEGACAAGVQVDKPSHPAVLVTTVEGMLQGRPIAN